MTNDCEKFNAARSLGWTVLTFTALHFSYRDRIKHKLTSPEETIMSVIERIQEEREAKPAQRMINNPVSPYETKLPISSVLRILASGENCEGSPYDQMIEAADYIESLIKI